MDEVDVFLQDERLSQIKSAQQLVFHCLLYLSFSIVARLLLTRTVTMMATMMRRMMTVRMLMVMTVLGFTSLFSRRGMSPA